MNLIEIEGPTELMQKLKEIEGLSLSYGSARKVGEDLWYVSGYASDEAINAIRSLGGTVTVKMDNEEMRQHLDEIFGPEKRGD